MGPGSATTTPASEGNDMSETGSSSPGRVDRDGWTVAGVQRDAAAGTPARVEIMVRGRATGSVDRGDGSDRLRVSVWDDGIEMDFKVLKLPLDTPTPVDVRLGFEGALSEVAGGVGITVVAGPDPNDERILDIDPFFPKRA